MASTKNRSRLLDSASVIGFIPTTNFRRAKAFYEGKLELRFVSRDAFALVLQSGGTTVRIAKAPGFKPAGFTILGWRVGAIEAAVAALVARGVVFERYSWMQQDVAGIWTAPGGARVAWFKDPDGNVLSLSTQ
ncbi:MAG: VOC family protein [Pseudomonadota bacterium]